MDPLPPVLYAAFHLDALLAFVPPRIRIRLLKRWPRADRHARAADLHERHGVGRQRGTPLERTVVSVRACRGHCIRFPSACERKHG